ncbi:hypothetical protein AAC387_Pa12g0943 [Persea americana]
MWELRSGAGKGRPQQQQQPIAVVEGQGVAVNTRRRRTPKNNQYVAQEPVAAAVDENIIVKDCGKELTSNLGCSSDDETNPIIKAVYESIQG